MQVKSFIRLNALNIHIYTHKSELRTYPRQARTGFLVPTAESEVRPPSLDNDADLLAVTEEAWARTRREEYVFSSSALPVRRIRESFFPPSDEVLFGSRL